MELKAGYKQTEIGVIPEDWAISQITDVCDFIVPGRNKPKIFDGNIPWVTTPDLINGQEVKQSRLGLKISRAEAKNVGSKIVPSGSILMSCVGDLGIVAITNGELVVNQQLHVYIPLEHINSNFLLQVLSKKRDYLYSIATKTALPYLNKENCNSIKIQLPLLQEQYAIAATLSDMDSLLAKLDALIAKKRDLKQAAMQQLLTAQIRLPGFSGEWEVKQIGDVLRVRHGKSQHHIEVQDGIFPILATGGEIGRTNTSLYDKPSVLIGRKGTIDKPQYQDTPFWTVDTLFYTEISNTALPKFIFFKFMMIDWRSYNEASGVPSLNASTIESIEILMPKIEEQTAITAVLSDMENEITTLEARRDKTRALKQGMMQELLTGKIRLI